MIRIIKKSIILFLALACLILVSCKSDEPKTTVEETPPVDLNDSINYLSPSDISDYRAGTIVDDDLLLADDLPNYFYASEISEDMKERIWNVSYKENDHISLDNLRYLRVLHWGFDGETHIGELIVNQSIANDILEIMYELYCNDYLIEKMVLIDEYGGDDELSMQDNNTSAFNYRLKTGQDSLSNHSLGLAIDINPLYNPYVVERANGEVYFAPSNSSDYINRDADFSYKLDSNDLCVRLFKEYGFSWGGDWNSSKDYQHFEK